MIEYNPHWHLPYASLQHLWLGAVRSQGLEQGESVLAALFVAGWVANQASSLRVVGCHQLRSR